MSRPVLLLSILAVLICLPVSAAADQTFSIDAYQSFLDANHDIPAATLISRHMPQADYYASSAPTTDLDTYAYFDSIMTKYHLTADEQDLLAANQFMITERLTYDNIMWAMQEIFENDLPVYISSDAILYALHMSYDHILMELEINIMKQNLSGALNALYDAVPDLAAHYADFDSLQTPIADADLYVCIAKSLLDGTPVTPQVVSQEVFDTVWSAVQTEEYCEMPLFCERARKLDFSQLTPRGHYAGEFQNILGPYFRSMMWLGRTDFLMTPPDEWTPWDESDIRRMCYGAVLVNELLEMSGAEDLLAVNERIVDFMVGESDNLTPAELTTILSETGVTGADGLLDDDTYDMFVEALVRAPGSGQKIISSIFVANPFTPESMTIPVSYRLIGQRFVIDSYTFSNVVFDRIVHNDEKVLRLMPDPLDAMFALGNDDAIHLLADELAEYPYAGELAAVRYLVDSYDNSFWTASLYNAWLEAIRTLNPGTAREGAPYFTTTAAWRQSQLTTQLASWAQLRHDTLLYAKQSYTPAAGCSFPHSYVEPNPDLFRSISVFAESANGFFSNLASGQSESIASYFVTLQTHMDNLAGLADKELAGEYFSKSDIAYLSEMLDDEGGGVCAMYNGWLYKLIYRGTDLWDFTGAVIADVHTQSSDEFGTIIGKVLHVASGNVNLGVFLAPSPSNGFKPMAYIGPVQSYYEKYTMDFDRYTDERWRNDLSSGDIPDRPDWVNCYLADSDGNRRADGRMLPNVASPLDVAEDDSLPVLFETVTAYPNPFNPSTRIRFTVAESGPVTLSLYTITGQKVATLLDERLQSGSYEASWNAAGLASGVYFCHLKTGHGHAVTKLSLVR